MDINDRHNGGDVIDFSKAQDTKWVDALIMTERKDGSLAPKNVVANVISILRHDHRWTDALAFNELTHDIEFLRQPPWFDDDAPADFDSKAWRTQALEEEDLTRAQSWLQRAFDMNPAGKLVSGGLAVVAKAQSYHPIRDYLDALEWDGVERIDSWLTTYCGATPTPYTRLVGPWWLISGVARIYEPGSKVDHVLVLEGRQGLRKSSLLESFCPQEEWFSDTAIDIGSKDAFGDIQGIWILEFAELDGVVGRKEVTSLKAFITSKSDRYRPPYGHVTQRVPRQVVFCGSANRDDYLRDPTGNRRFWPVRCTKTDVEGVVRDRDQLWAEAVQRYRDDARWYPDNDEERALCEAEQQARMQSDDRVQKIEVWIAEKPPNRPITVLAAIEEALKIKDSDKQGKRLQSEVADMLRQLGYVRASKQVTFEGKRIRPYVLEGSE